MLHLFQINLGGSGNRVIMFYTCILNGYIVSKENKKLLNLEMALWNN